jgi:hypothetical protein
VGHEQRPAIYNESRGSFYFYAPTSETSSNVGPNNDLEEEKFWNDTKTIGNKEAYDSYLNRYPNGHFSSLAKANLLKFNNKSSVEADKLRKSLINELGAWNEAKKRGTIEDYKIYLKSYPNGFFSSLAADSISIINEELNISQENQGTEKIAIANKALAESKKRLHNEEKANIELINTILRIDVPTF